VRCKEQQELQAAVVQQTILFTLLA